ncbi:MAG: low molecular weight phosphotyrosine protein phosphatase [Anaerolineales bacterium]|nr:low molecular weight phosphotyrosine protein phosphatase [Anaerolineales bacterium]
MPKILFVCTGNMYRSPLAAEIFIRKLLEDGKSGNWVVASAGTWTKPDQPAPQDARLAANNLGLDLGMHRTRLVDAEMLDNQDLILVMESGHKEALVVEFPIARKKIYLLSEVVDQQVYDLPDPMKSGQIIDELAADISAMIERGYTNIFRLAKKLSN